MHYRKNIKQKRKELIILCMIISLPVAYLANNLTFLWIKENGDFLHKLNYIINDGINLTIERFEVYTSVEPLVASVISVLIIVLIFMYNSFDVKNERQNEEYGSSKFSSSSDISQFVDKKDENNQILTNTEKLSLNTRLHKINNNILVVGSSGSGKTRYHVKPNIMQLNCNYIITDPKGTLIKECGKLLNDNGYRVISFNTYNFNESMKYNPFDYIKNEEDILSIVNTIILNTKGEGNNSGEDFWVKAERLLYTAYISYIFYCLKENEKNFSTLIDIIIASKTNENVENYKNPMDIIFEEMEESLTDPNDQKWFPIRQYKAYKLAAGKTAKSILISCSARLAPFDISKLRNITEEDELNLIDLTTGKVALFLCPSDTDPTFNFMIGILYTQLLQLLAYEADYTHNGYLPRHVKFILDEFANIALIPNFEKIISVVRSRNISVTVILQTLAQLKDIYKEKAEIITGNCSSWIFLGGKEKSTLKEVSEIIGKETVDLKFYNETKGNQGSININNQKIARDLMSADEIATMDKDKCILLVDGLRPFFSDKYKIEKHKNYKYLLDYDENNKFDFKNQKINDGFEIPKNSSFKVYSEYSNLGL